MDQRTVRVALVTGCPCAGKSTVTRSACGRLGLPRLESDVEVFDRIFRLARRPELIGHIGTPALWEPLRSDFDLDRLFRLHHRDWLARHALPPAFVAEGWIYAKRQWRAEARAAFDGKVEGRRFEYRLFVLRPEEEAFPERFESCHRERHGEDHWLFERQPEARRELALGRLRDFLERELEPPAPEEMGVERVGTSDELERGIARFCVPSSGGSGT